MGYNDPKVHFNYKPVNLAIWKETLHVKMKKFERERMGFIETRLLWGEGITAGELGNAFEISRPIAQKTINDYRKKFSEHIEYNRSLKRHMPGPDFKPHFIKSDPLKFLDYLRGESLVGYYREETDWSEFEIYDVNRFITPELDFNIIKNIFTALHRKQTLLIEYQKKDLDPSESTERIISPNHLVFVDNRYHIRAYCHLRNEFRDFVLSRIIYTNPSYTEPSYKDWVPSTEDKEWNTMVTMSFTPNPELPEGVQRAILRNYQTAQSDTIVIKCKKALAPYIERNLMAINEKYKKPLWIKNSGAT